MMAGRYAHAKQFKRHHRELRFLRSRLGRISRDLGRKIAGQPALERRKPAPHVHLGAETRRVRRYQTRAQTPLGHRGRYRPHEERRPSRPFVADLIPAEVAMFSSTCIIIIISFRQAIPTRLLLISLSVRPSFASPAASARHPRPAAWCASNSAGAPLPSGARPAPSSGRRSNRRRRPR